MNKKYEFTGQKMLIIIDVSHELHRIRRLSDGKLGGWIESEDNLSQEGDCWVDDHAQVYGDAKVYGNAKVHGGAVVHDHAKVRGNADIDDNACVFGYAIVEDNTCINSNAFIYGKATIKDHAHVYGDACVYDDAKVYGCANISRNARVHGNAEVYDNAQICGEANVSGNACVYDNAKVYGLASVYDNVKVSGNACVYGDAKVYGDANVRGWANVYDHAKVCGNAVVRDSVLNGDMRVDGNDAMGRPVELIPEPAKYSVCITNGYYSNGSHMSSFTKQDVLEYLASAIEDETDDYYFEYKTWEKTAADGTPAMGLIIYNKGYDEKIGYYDEELTLKFVNEKQLPVTWHDVEMFMKGKESEHETITDIPEPVESCEDGMSTDNTKECGE
jgi:carbonic anhydrase/acetyltransferase-like protein (isoleucine patch superfamily)